MNTPRPRWNGEPCSALQGYALVADAPEFPQYWARSLVGKRRAVVLVIYNGHSFYLDNEDGSGWEKVTVGGGGPRYPHSNLSIRPGSFFPDA